MRRCCVPGCSSTDKLYFCGSCERPLHEGCTRPLQWPLNSYCIYCLDCQKEPWLQGAFIQAGGKAGKAGCTYAQIKSAVEDIIKQHVAARKAAGRTTTYSGLRSAGREISQQWEKMTDENLDLNIGFRFARIPDSDSMRRSQVRWHLAMNWDDSPMAQCPRDAQALMQLADAAAEVGAIIDEAAGVAGPEPAIHKAAADPFNNIPTADSTAKAAASACLKDTDTISAANAAPISLAIGTRQTSTHSRPPSIPKVQTPRQASAAGATRTQVPMAMKQASCAAPHVLSGITATLAHDDEASPSQKDDKSVTAFASNHVKHMEPSRVDNTAVKQSQNADKHDRSLNAGAFLAPKAVRNQTIPNMFHKKKKAQLVELAPQLNRVKPYVNVIDLVNDEEVIAPAASGTPSRHDFGSKHDEAEIIVIDDDSDGVVNIASADMPVGKIPAMAPLSILHRTQKPDKKALIVDMLESLEQCDSRLSKRFKEEEHKCTGRAAYDDLISRMHSGLQETLEEIEQLPMSEQENDVANYFRVFLGFQPAGNFI